MGEVYRGRDTRLDRSVAIKVLPPHLAADADAEARFVREGRAIAALAHPNLITLHDVGTEHGVSFAVMELLEGETLRARLQGGPLPVRKVIDYAGQTARGLAAAHDRGIVHRDLKPENIFVTTDGRVKILDFGLARQDARSPGGDLTTVPAHTMPGVVLGTAGYMAPEQVRGLVADHRADVFAFGAVLYEMVAGRRAFARDTMAETMTAILNDDPSPLPGDRQVPAALDRIIHHCLEKAPSERFHSAADLAFQLDTLANPSGSTEASLVAPVGTRGRLPMWAAIVVALAAGALIGWGIVARMWPVGSPTAPAGTHVTVMTYSGTDYSPAVSPDGRTIAFMSGRDGRDRIWLRQVATGEEAALTDGDDSFPRFSPDGATILFTRVEAAASALYRVPVLGGAPRKVLADAADVIGHRTRRMSPSFASGAGCPGCLARRRPTAVARAKPRELRRFNFEVRAGRRTAARSLYRVWDWQRRCRATSCYSMPRHLPVIPSRHLNRAAWCRRWRGRAAVTSSTRRA